MPKPPPSFGDTSPSQSTDTLLMADSEPAQTGAGWATIKGRRMPHYVAVATGLAFTLQVLMVWLPWSAEWRELFSGLLVVHVAMVIAFIGGIHWGIGLRYAATTGQVPVFHIVWGPLPAYLAWAVTGLPGVWALVVLGLLFLWTHEIDRRVWPGCGLAPWMPLRSWFTVFAVVGCLAGALGMVWHGGQT